MYQRVAVLPCVISSCEDYKNFHCSTDAHASQPYTIDESHCRHNGSEVILPPSLHTPTIIGE